jgi:hypothetical protein
MEDRPETVNGRPLIKCANRRGFLAEAHEKLVGELFCMVKNC